MFAETAFLYIRPGTIADRRRDIGAGVSAAGSGTYALPFASFTDRNVRYTAGRNKSLIGAFGALIATALVASAAYALDRQPIVGQASVIDGDTIEIHGQRIRLHGIDAPEGRQPCEDAAGKTYRCGQRAAFALSDKIDSKTVRCDPKTTDRYHRVVAVCWLGSLNLNAWMVAQGWAIAYRYFSKEYVPQEDEARKAKHGIWAGSFIEPYEWRKAQRR